MSHTERSHALLSASSAKMWLTCTPSARLGEHVPDRGSAFADEGTAAHELAEARLAKMLAGYLTGTNVFEQAAIDRAKTSDWFNPEMDGYIDNYVQEVFERYRAAILQTPDATMLLEQRLDFSKWVPDAFGTGDVLIIADGVMDVIDLKYGKGVPVSAHDNPQMRLYGLGALDTYGFLYDIHTVRMTIIQPRLDSISSEEIAVTDLLAWGEDVVKPAAKLAFAGEGEFRPGLETCRWCKVKATCKARADHMLAAAKYEMKNPALLSHDEIGSILHLAGQLQAWAKDVEAYAFAESTRGARFPGWKLVEGRSNRKIVDEEAVVGVLMQDEEMPKGVSFFKPAGLKPLTELERLYGKKRLADLLGDLIEKPPGKPVLVPDHDKRPELGSPGADFAEEDFE